jgi:hypothetical protein
MPQEILRRVCRAYELRLLRREDVNWDALPSSEMMTTLEQPAKGRLSMSSVSIKGAQELYVGATEAETAKRMTEAVGYQKIYKYTNNYGDR